MDSNGAAMRQSNKLEQKFTSLAPWVPTPSEIGKQMLELAQVNSKDTVYDLGCGDARMLITAVKEFGARKAVGYEIRQSLYNDSMKEIQRQHLQNRITVIKSDLLDADLSEASVIVLYLTTRAIELLKPKLEKEAKSATRIVSYDFPMNKWRPDKKVQFGDYSFSTLCFTRTLYLYVVPQAFQSSSDDNPTDQEK